MNFVNRISLIVTPKPLMHQWVADVAADEAPTLEEMTAESSCYLLDEPQEDCDIAELTATLIEQNFLKIWQNELSVWDEYLDNVPNDMSQTQFNQWFDVKLSGLTFDLANEPLLVAKVD